MPVEKSDLSLTARAGYMVGYVTLRAVIGATMLVPYRWRIPGTAWVTARTLARWAGFHRRIRENLALVFPDMPKAEVSRLCVAVSDNATRTAMEIFSTRPFLERAQDATAVGAGWEAMAEARVQGRPVILCSAHIGNFTMIRAAFQARGLHLGALIRRMANPYFHTWYKGKLAAIGEPSFEQGRRGMMEMVRYLRNGQTVGILTDLHAHGGEELTFFGQMAHTSLVTAELALRYDALLVPTYALRQPDGMNFNVLLREPIPHTDPRTMTQAMNDDLEEVVRDHMDQWFWTHRRWKAYTP